MMKTLRYISALLPLISLALLIIIFSTSNPVAIGPLGVLFVFGLIYLLFASSLFLVLHGGVALVERFIPPQRLHQARHWQLGIRRAYYVASIAAFGPVMLLAMNSVGQLQWRDVLLVVTLLGLAVFYAFKKSS